jgi:hypothetical protein
LDQKVDGSLTKDTLLDGMRMYLVAELAVGIGVAKRGH